MRFVLINLREKTVYSLLTVMFENLRLGYHQSKVVRAELIVINALNQISISLQIYFLKYQNIAITPLSYLLDEQ